MYTVQCTELYRRDGTGMKRDGKWGIGTKGRDVQNWGMGWWERKQQSGDINFY